MNYLFTTEKTIKKADEIINYLRGPRLFIAKNDYPDYENWLKKVHFQLKTEEKRAILGLSNGNVVGVIIYQKHQSEPDTLEIKNISVKPDQEGRHIASFMLRNSEIEGAKDFKINKIKVDSKEKNLEIRNFLLKNKYNLHSTTDLYCLGSGRDIIYGKQLSI